MKETAIPGNYLVFQNEKLHYPILWMSNNGTIKVQYCAPLKFMNAGTFNNESWEHSVQSYVQERENNNIRVAPSVKLAKTVITPA